MPSPATKAIKRGLAVGIVPYLYCNFAILSLYACKLCQSFPCDDLASSRRATSLPSLGSLCVSLPIYLALSRLCSGFHNANYPPRRLTPPSHEVPRLGRLVTRSVGRTHPGCLRHVRPIPPASALTVGFVRSVAHGRSGALHWQRWPAVSLRLSTSGCTAKGSRRITPVTPCGEYQPACRTDDRIVITQTLFTVCFGLGVSPFPLAFALDLFDVAAICSSLPPASRSPS